MTSGNVGNLFSILRSIKALFPSYNDHLALQHHSPIQRSIKAWKRLLPITRSWRLGASFLDLLNREFVHVLRCRRVLDTLCSRAVDVTQHRPQALISSGRSRLTRLLLKLLQHPKHRQQVLYELGSALDQSSSRIIDKSPYSQQSTPTLAP